MQRSNELAAAKQSWLSQKIPRKRIPAILNLLPVKDEVLALAGMDKAGLKQSFGALTKDVLALNGVQPEVLHAEFMAAERYCYGMHILHWSKAVHHADALQIPASLSSRPPGRPCPDPPSSRKRRREARFRR